nr:MAG TPA: hypothetical protein [Caudoviricetes sp.]
MFLIDFDLSFEKRILTRDFKMIFLIVKGGGQDKYDRD